MKKLFIVLALLFLTACGGYDPYDPSMYGYYVGTTIDAAGFPIAMTQVYKGENYLHLQAEGEGTLCLSGHEYSIEWGMKDGEFVLVLQKDKSYGTVEQGQILLNYLGMDTILHFEPRHDYRPGYIEAVTPAQKQYNGDWYGWWVIDYADGIYAGQAGSWWDLCANVSLYESDTGMITLWDQDYSRSNPLGEVELMADEGGVLYSGEGYFGAATVGQGDWCIDPESHGTEDMMVIQGYYETEEGGFVYTAYLRPWGVDWEEIAQKPYHYEDWYLPLIMSEQSMPDSIGE